jgi:hypothetical protein
MYSKIHITKDDNIDIFDCRSRRHAPGDPLPLIQARPVSRIGVAPPMVGRMPYTGRFGMRSQLIMIRVN